MSCASLAITAFGLLTSYHTLCLAERYTILAVHTMSCALLANMIPLLPAIQCLVPLWLKLLLPAKYLMPYWFFQLQMSCAFVAKTAFAGYAISCVILLLYWCLAWQCPVPVGTTFSGNQITTYLDMTLRCLQLSQSCSMVCQRCVT